MKKRIVVSVIEILLACLVIVAMLFGTFYVSRKIDQRFFTGKSYIYLYPEEDNTPISVSLSDDTKILVEFLMISQIRKRG